PPQTTILLGGSVMEEKLREVNRIKGSYALVDRYGEEEREKPGKEGCEGSQPRDSYNQETRHALFR
ncbi:hypothetical protein KUCAC02_028985, partial [Chaenocephalus aceratus]